MLLDRQSRRVEVERSPGDGRELAAAHPGRRPEPSTPRCGRSLDRALREKGEYITRHRDRLAKLARQYVEAEQAKARRLIEQLQATRDELASAREAELWVRCFGDQPAGAMPDLRPMCGARREPLQLAGITGMVQADRVLAAFHNDIDWLGNACTDEQRQLIDGPGELDLRKDAIWNETDEGKAAMRREQERIRREHLAVWGDLPA